MWLKQVLGFPGWSDKSICWKCRADWGRYDWRDVGAAAAWRSARHSDRTFFAQMRAMGVAPSPIFNLPGFKLDHICIDVLHALDLGFTQVVLANIIWEYKEFCEGSTMKVRISKVWTKLKAHYRTMCTPNRLQDLTVTMVRKDNGSLKMRTKGAETRSLVPFGVILASEMHEEQQSSHTKSVYVCISHLLDFYMLMCLPEYNVQAGAEACRRCLSMYKALSLEAASNGEEQRWKLKPKAHLFQELAEFQSAQWGNPRNFWTYADEDFVGWVATIARSRGGPKQASTAARRVMERYRAMK